MEPQPTPGTAGTLVSSRCAHCGGGLRADAPWCTLCLTPARPPRVAEPEPARQPSPVASTAGLDPLTAPLELLLGQATEPSAPTWPCTACSTQNALALPACATCGSPFLAAVLRDEPPLLVLPLLGDVSHWSKLQWFGAGGVLMLVLLVGIVTLGALLGWAGAAGPP